MATVADVLVAKGSGVHSVTGMTSVYDAIDKMVRYNIGALVVLEGGNLQGIVTERDYLRRVALVGRTSKTTAVREIMSPSPETVSTANTVEECMQLMTRLRVRHLPVLTMNRIVGIVSIGDVVKSLLNEQACHIQNLTEYIQGRA
jgi:CBS domain-containing protein